MRCCNSWLPRDRLLRHGQIQGGHGHCEGGRRTDCGGRVVLYRRGMLYTVGRVQQGAGRNSAGHGNSQELGEQEGLVRVCLEVGTCYERMGQLVAAMAVLE